MIDDSDLSNITYKATINETASYIQVEKYYKIIRHNENYYYITERKQK